MKKFYGIFIMLVLVQISFAQKITVPQPIAPEEGYAYCMPDVILDWNPVAGVGEISYKVQLATDAAFTNLVVNEVGVSPSAYYNMNLQFGQEYFWRIKAEDDLGSSEWSAVSSFTVFSQIIQDKPSDADDGIDLRPDIKWKDKVDGNLIAGFDGIQVELDTVETFDSPINRMYTTDGIVFKMAPDYLLFGEMYYWRIRPKHATGAGEWSPTRSFETVPGVTLNKPNNNTSNVEFDISLTVKDLANQADDIFEYTFEVSIDEAFTDPVTLITNELEVQPEFLKFGKTYYWRAKAAHANDMSPWADSRTFSTVNTLTLTAPADGSVSNTVRPKLEWNSIAAVGGYQVRISKNSDMSGATLYTLPGTDVNNLPLSSLDTESDYYWSVRAYKASDTSAWAENFTFNIPWNVGVDELGNLKELSIYPNPATTSVSVQFISKQSSDVQVTITDVLGKNILQQTFPINAGKFQQSFDVADLNKGIYFLEIEQGDIKSVKKFIVE